MRSSRIKPSRMTTGKSSTSAAVRENWRNVRRSVRSARPSRTSGRAKIEPFREKASTPKANSPRAGSPRAGSSRAGSPKANSPRAGSPRANSSRASTPRANSRATSPVSSSGRNIAKNLINLGLNKYIQRIHNGRNQLFNNPNAFLKVMHHLNDQSLASLAKATEKSKRGLIARKRLSNVIQVDEVTKELLKERIPPNRNLSPTYNPTINAIRNQYIKQRNKNGRNISNNTTRATINSRLDSIENLKQTPWRLPDPFHPSGGLPSHHSKSRLKILPFYFVPNSPRIDNEKMKVFATAISYGALSSLEHLDLAGALTGTIKPTKNFAETFSKVDFEPTETFSKVENMNVIETMKTFSNVLPNGALASLKLLNLNQNQIGQNGMEAFSSALRSGALATLDALGLAINQIDDESMMTFSKALSSGALASLKELNLGYNKIGDGGMEHLSSALSRGALGSLEQLYLNGNQIGDEGISALSRHGTLETLKILDLNGNQIGDEGSGAFLGALRSGALPSIEKIELWGNPAHSMKTEKALRNLLIRRLKN